MPAAGEGVAPFARFLEEGRARVDAVLSAWLADEAGIPDDLRRAMTYSVAAGGKRIRPLLCLMVAEGLGASGEGLLRAAAAFELLHTYSLIHDDLPALDDDDLRRGKPTCHRAFSEATAILAGDALQALAFDWLAGTAARGLPAERVLEAVRVFARAVGPAGMVGGQSLDMAGEGRSLTMGELQAIHRGKTGALLAAAVEVGAVLAGAVGEERALLRAWGEQIGLLFQIVDDILDVVGDAAALGKTPGKDVRTGKVTYPSLVGLDEARRLARAVHDEAQALAARLPRPVPRLAGMTSFLLERTF
ncbi:MAG: polyprenyl synthetase family protein [Candidatus Riflebacteria bacterium]|nr:polyprenyl synthetase family protein [Candidatus Riflebacteria bacterium]